MTGPGRLSRPYWMVSLAAMALHPLRSAVRVARASPMPDAAYPAFEYVLVQRRPSRFVARASRQDCWRMFSFDVMVLTLIR